jgi:DNA adenine methylase
MANNNKPPITTKTAVVTGRPKIKTVSSCSLTLAFCFPRFKNVFIFLDPPYDILTSKKVKSLYGKNGEIHKGFEHERFYLEFVNCKHRGMITYNNSENLRSRYEKFNLVEWEMKYGMTCSKKNSDLGDEKKLRSGKELLIMNY